MSDNIQNSINEAIDIIINKRIDSLKLDKTVIGIIDSLVSPLEQIYKIQYDGGFFYARALQKDAVFSKGMSVYIQIPQNDFSKEKIIVGRANVLREEKKADLIISSMNNFAIVGNSVVTPTNETQGIGIMSYHNPEWEKTDPDNHPITHRAKLLYSSDNNSNTHYNINSEHLRLYKESATALMVEADFRTALTKEQRYSGSRGVYGIGLNLVFENANYQYGTTQEEVFDYFAPQISAVLDTSITADTDSFTTSMKKIKDEVTEKIRNATDFRTLIDKDGVFDQYIAYATELTRAYAEASPASYTDEMKDIMEAYISLLSSLKNFNSLLGIQKEYNEWLNTVINPAAEKTVSYVLNSNMMIGNPFSFSSWSTQYAMFDIDLEHFERIDSVVFYKDGFISDATQEIIKGEDIFVRNLKIYVLQPISAVNEDYRLEIESPQGLIFEDEDSEDKSLSIRGKTTKAFYEDISTSSTYYWFIKDPSVSTVSSTGYKPYGGIGWRYIGGPDSKGNSAEIKIFKKEHSIYKTVYKCVSSLDDDAILLAQEFIVYNNSIGTDVRIVSNLGTSFSFDAGAPILTAEIKEKGTQEYKELVEKNSNTIYNFYWTIKMNQTTIVLEPSYLQSLQSVTWDDTNGTFIQQKMSIIDTLTSTEGDIFNLLKNIQFYKLDELITEINDGQNAYGSLLQATRIRYPVENISTESTITFNCKVCEVNGTSKKFIGESEIILKNEGTPQIGGYRIVLENGDQVFQYDEYGNAPNSEKLKSPLEIKTVIPHLYTPGGIEVANKNFKVEWTFPVEETMIVPSNDLKPNPADGLRLSLDTNSQCSFDITKLYNEDHLNNQILCKIKFGEQILQKETDFYFGKVGSNGTNGTDVVAKIVPVSSNQILNSQPVTVYLFGGFTWFNFGKFNGQNIYLGHNNNNKDDPNQIFIVKLYQKGQEIAPENFYAVRWNVAGNTSTSSNRSGKKIEITSGDLDRYSIQWNEQLLGDLNLFTLRAEVVYQNKSYYAFYTLPVINYKDVTSLPTYSRIGINKKTLLKEIVYNADGRNPVYNHNQGVELLNVPNETEINWSTEGNSFTLLENKEDKNGVKTLTTTNNMIYILPNDEYAGEPCNTNVIANLNINGTDIEVIIPIHMSLNTYSLASLNAWDGNSVTVDYENQYIMAPQIGAGYKEEVNNRFTGVMMGTAAVYGSEESQTGLLGYSHGVQSIFLDSETGEATFGLPSGYRLEKSGNTYIPKKATGDKITYDKSEAYNEGQIKLVPGGVSTVGGWRLGRRSLYYAKEGNIGSKYNKDYVPNKNGDIKEGNIYHSHHEKDIGHNDSGILLQAGADPYISIKGRQLWPKEQGNSIKGIPDRPPGAPDDSNVISDNADSYIDNGDSLELQLDPRTPTLFTIFRHNGSNKTYQKANGDIETLYEAGTRTFLAGINAKGQLVANGLQDVSTTSSGAQSTTTSGAGPIYAFGNDTTSGPQYIGLSFSNGDNKGVKLFVDDNENSPSSTLYYSGASSANNEYQRPLAFYGQNINLYARETSTGRTVDKTSTSKITISENHAFMGIETENDQQNSYLSLYGRGSNAISTLLARNELNIIGSRGKNTSNYGVQLVSKWGSKINLAAQTTTGTSTLTDTTKAQIILNPNPNSTDNYGIYAQGSGQIRMYSNNNQKISLSKRNKDASGNYVYYGLLELADNYIDLRLDENTDATTANRLYLTNNSEKNSALRSTRPLYISSNGGQVGISATGTTESIEGVVLTANAGSNFKTTVGVKSSTTGQASGSTDEYTIFSVGGTNFNDLKYKTGAKPRSLVKQTADKNSPYYTSGLEILGAAKTRGGIRTNWGYFQGYLFGSDDQTTDTDYTQVSLFAEHKIYAQGDIKTDGGTSGNNQRTISLYNHTHPFSLAVTLSSASGGATMTGTGKWTIKANIKATVTGKDNLGVSLNYDTVNVPNYERHIGDCWYIVNESEGTFAKYTDQEFYRKKSTTTTYIVNGSVSGTVTGKGSLGTSISFEDGPYTLSGTSGSPNNNTNHVNNSSPNI